MNTTSDTLKEVTGNDTPKPVGLGEYLRSKRFEKDLSIGDVSKQLRLSSSIIEALEAEDFSKLPGSTFVRGYLRSYARLLSLPENLLSQYDYPLQGEPAVVAPPITLFKKQASVNDRSIRWLSYLILMGLGALVLMWWRGHQTMSIPTDALGNAADVTSAQASNGLSPNMGTPGLHQQTNLANGHQAVTPIPDVPPIQGDETPPNASPQNIPDLPGQKLADLEKQLNLDRLSDGQAAVDVVTKKIPVKQKPLTAPVAPPKGGLVSTRNLSMLETGDEMPTGLQDKLHMDGFSNKVTEEID